MDSATTTPQNGWKHRTIVDTHRHPWGQKMQAKIEERGLLDPKQGFPQTNALDLMAYREVFDLDYAMPIQREGGITWKTSNKVFRLGLSGTGEQLIPTRPPASKAA